MIRGNELEEQVYEPDHIQQVLTEIEHNFPTYFESFSKRPLDPLFKERIKNYEKEQKKYSEYLNPSALREFDYDPNAFKSHTRKNCPIIRRCLMSQDEVMKDYKMSFGMVTGRQLLDSVRLISEFGMSYVVGFDDEAHEDAAHYNDLRLEILNEPEYGTRGVIGYGVQSSLLFGLYARHFAHRSQNAVWSLYFLSGRKSFGLEDESEFLMVEPKRGRCEQNYFYPAELFGFYALQVFLLLKSSCSDLGISLRDRHRYTYLSTFCDHVAESNREIIETYTRSSQDVESKPWFWS